MTSEKIPPIRQRKKTSLTSEAKELRQPRIERGAHRELHMATMDFTTKPLTLFTHWRIEDWFPNSGL